MRIRCDLDCQGSNVLAAGRMSLARTGTARQKYLQRQVVYKETAAHVSCDAL